VLRLARARRAARPRPRGTWPRAARRWHAILIALGLVLAQGSALLHLALIPHATCEHGELVEGPRPAKQAGIGAAEGRPERPQIEQGHQDGGGHAHCDALALRHRLPDVLAPVAEASLLCIAPIEACGAGVETRPVPLLSLAPKGSPPSRRRMRPRLHPAQSAA
jgi:hypothetical protein